ncbi:hypothetical protein AGMMS50212_00030 [Spirochaetia bacterium]|nr:hypothetical protein AGMMS50212_00030 [Spirochaetia bacterium]
MIFLSHNCQDKDVVEPIAVALRNKYGEQNVFYDSWSMKPGENIIGKMDEGLSRCKYFFFFVSQKSLDSGMVNLEWTTALYKSVKDGIKFIPIKIDNSSQPTILLTTVYINMCEIGMKETLEKIVGTVDDKDTSVYKATFENLYCEVERVTDFLVKIAIKARKFKESDPHIAVSYSNKITSHDDVKLFIVNNTSSIHGWCMVDGVDGDEAQTYCETGKIISPDKPLVFTLEAKTKEPLHGIRVWSVNGKKLKQIDTMLVVSIADA